MADTVDNDVLAMTVIHDNDEAGEQINRYQFKKTAGGPVDDAELLDTIAVIVQTLYTLVLAAIHVRNVLREVGVFNVTQNRIVGTTDGGTYIGGSGIDPGLPQGVAGYVYFKTNVPKVILSKYLPSSTTNKVTGTGIWIAAQTVLYTSFATSLMLPFVFGAHEYVYGYLSPKTLAFEVPDLAVVPRAPAYMRKRKPGRGS